MKTILIASILAISALLPFSVGADGNGPQVDFNGDCIVSIGDVQISLQERGYEYTVRFVVPAFGTFGPDVCWPPSRP